jgi:hypothetical protein
MDCLLDQLRATRRAKQAPLKVIVLYNRFITYLKLTKAYLNNVYNLDQHAKRGLHQKSTQIFPCEKEIFRDPEVLKTYQGHTYTNPDRGCKIYDHFQFYEAESTELTYTHKTVSFVHDRFSCHRGLLDSASGTMFPIGINLTLIGWENLKLKPYYNFWSIFIELFLIMKALQSSAPR